MHGRIWRPEAPLLNFRRYREATLISPPIGVAGFFEAELIHARTGIVVERYRFPNMVVDAGLDYLGTGRLDVLAYIGVGTDNTAPAAGQTDLLAPLVRTNSTAGVPSPVNSHTLAADQSHIVHRWTRQFTTAQANGTLTEVGMFQSASGGAMFARNLFTDAAGNPIAVVKTSEYELRVTYELRLYPAPDFTYTADIAGVAGVEVTATPYGYISSLTSWPENFPLGGIANSTAGSTIFADTTGNPARGSNANPPGTTLTHTSSAYTIAAYVNGTFYREATFDFGSGTANDTGMNQIRAGNYFSFYHYFPGAPISKTNTQKLVLNMRRSWARHV